MPTSGQNSSTSSDRSPLRDLGDSDGVDAPGTGVEIATLMDILNNLSNNIANLSTNITDTINTALSNALQQNNITHSQVPTPGDGEKDLPFSSGSMERSIDPMTSSMPGVNARNTANGNRYTSFQAMDNDIFQRTFQSTSSCTSYSGVIPIYPVEPPKFGGDPNLARAWLREYSEICTINGYDDQQKKMRMVAYLSEEAKDWYYALRAKQPGIPWDQLQREFLSDFSTPNTSKELFKQLCEAKQKKEERPFAFLMRIQRLCHDFNAEMPEKEIVQWCLSGMDSYISNSIRCNVEKHQRTLKWLKEQLKEWATDSEEDEGPGIDPRNRNHVAEEGNRIKCPERTNKEYMSHDEEQDGDVNRLHTNDEAETVSRQFMSLVKRNCNGD